MILFLKIKNQTMKKNSNSLLVVCILLLLPTTFSFAQVNPDCPSGVEVLDFSPLDGSTDAIVDINAAGLTLAGEVLTMTNVFNGGATGDEDTVNDDHLGGCIGPKLGITGSTDSVNTNMTTTYNFSGPLDDFCFKLVDLDRNDEIQVNGCLNGVPYTLTPADFSFPYVGPDPLCPDYLGGNTFTSLCIPPEPSINDTSRGAVDICFPGPIDKIEFIFYDKGTTTGGSYTVCDMGVCLEPLPLELAGFSANEANCQVGLNWRTITETNFSHFELEKSSNGSDYATIARVDGKGSEIAGAEYTFTDNQLTKNNYYRLRMFDNDGFVTVSYVRTVRANCANGVSISDVYPNPVRTANSKIRFTSTVNDDNATVVVMDLLSRIVSQQEVDVKEGTNIIDLEAGNLHAGTYYLLLAGDNWKTGTVRFVKQ